MAEYELSPQNPPAGGQSVNGWLIVILLLVFAVLVYRMVGTGQGPLLNPQAAPRAVTARGDLAADEQAQIELFREASPSVVHITSLAVRRDRLSTNLFEIPQGSGSGFIWDAEGYVVTNFHVIQQAQVARVTLTDNSTWDARLVGVHPDKDLAVLKIDAPQARLKPIAIGTSKDLLVGQKVFALGNPFGLDLTLTTGVISGVGREIQSVTGRPIEGVIQTDAAINPGNSGGPLLDSAGRLIGVNTAIFSPSGAYAGVGFAVPVDTVNQVVPELIQHGRVERPGLGVQIFDDSLVDQFRLRGVLQHKGVLVRDVLPNSPAEAAGVRPTSVNEDRELVLGDLIVALNGEKVENSDDLFQLLEGKSVGETVTLTVRRDDEQLQIPITLQALAD